MEYASGQPFSKKNSKIPEIISKIIEKPKEFKLENFNKNIESINEGSLKESLDLLIHILLEENLVGILKQLNINKKKAYEKISGKKYNQKNEVSEQAIAVFLDGINEEENKKVFLKEIKF